MITINRVSSSSRSTGIGFIGLLTIVFITLKLLDKINWSWLWVLSPIWISILFWIAFALFVLVVSLIYVLVSDFTRNRRRRKSNTHKIKGRNGKIP